ncbi:MAG: hypothetical protein NC548_63965 [Lachnospiraceae bacterium]|nr:hypothetical protein [Lachnospiraceae bacterium]
MKLPATRATPFAISAPMAGVPPTAHESVAPIALFTPTAQSNMHRQLKILKIGFIAIKWLFNGWLLTV